MTLSRSPSDVEPPEVGPAETKGAPERSPSDVEAPELGPAESDGAPKRSPSDVEAPEGGPAETNGAPEEAAPPPTMYEQYTPILTPCANESVVDAAFAKAEADGKLPKKSP